MTKQTVIPALARMAFCMAAATFMLTDAVQAQSHPIGPQSRFQPMFMESGPRANLAAENQVVFADVVRLDGAHWVRLHFEELTLVGNSRIRYTSLFDGDVQEMGAEEAAMWNSTSAYFNGDSVLVELIAAPGTRGNKLALDKVEFEPLEEDMALTFCGICSGDDDRVLSDEDFAGRIMNPGVCSGAVYNSDSCIVTAGHCISGSSQLIQFRVPDSFNNCNIANPSATHQYPILDTIANNGGVGNDWAVGTTGTSFGLTIVERYGEFRPLADSVPSSGTVDIWGFGASKICVRNHVQQLSQGPITGLDGTTIFHRAVTTGGNSGSGILVNDEIVGVVTHCSSNCPPGSNIGTRIDHPSFANAIDSLCPPDPPVPPDNDDCADRIVLADGTTDFSTINATTDGPNEQLCSFFGDTQVQKDVWFEHTATCSGDLTVSVCDSDFVTKLAIYSGSSCPTAPDTAVDCDVTGCANNRSTLTIPVQQGEDFIIRVGGRVDQTGEGVVEITCEETQDPCDGDFNGDEVVDGADLLAMLSDWGPCAGCDTDLNNDDVVDGADLLTLLSNWGQCP